MTAMIQGAVNARHEAVVRLRVRGPGGVESDIDTVVDTGFTGSLTLPPTPISALGLIRLSGGSRVLADGSTRSFDLYGAEVAWGSGWRPVLASAVGHEALIGMRLIAGHSLRVDVMPGGMVAVEPMP